MNTGDKFHVNTRTMYLAEKFTLSLLINLELLRLVKNVITALRNYRLFNFNKKFNRAKTPAATCDICDGIKAHRIFSFSI